MDGGECDPSRRSVWNGAIGSYITYGRSKVCRILCNRGLCRRVRRGYSLLQCLYDVRLLVFSPRELSKEASGDNCTLLIYDLPRLRQVGDESINVGVVCVWGLGEFFK